MKAGWEEGFAKPILGTVTYRWCPRLLFSPFFPRRLEGAFGFSLGPRFPSSRDRQKKVSQDRLSLYFIDNLIFPCWEPAVPCCYTSLILFFWLNVDDCSGTLDSPDFLCAQSQGTSFSEFPLDTWTCAKLEPCVRPSSSAPVTLCSLPQGGTPSF